MTLPLMPAAAASRSGWRVAAAVLLLLLAWQTASVPVRAEEGDPFSATVTVDATAETVIKARELARIDGQRRALAALVERLSGSAAKLPRLDDKVITDLVASFEVANERMSAVRYIAEYTFHFRPAEVRRVLGNAGISLAAGPAPAPALAEQSDKPVVLVPVYQAGARSALWDDPNPWRDGWERQSPPAGGLRVVVPLGDAGDVAAIDADKARAGDAEALTAVARRNGGEDAVVALAALRGAPERPSGLDVTLRRYRAGRFVAERTEALTAGPGESANDLLRRAAAAIVSNIGSGWKTEPSAPDQEGTLTAVLPITSLEDWLRARERLGAVAAIRKVSLLALSRQEVTVEIGYVGGIDELKDGLAEISLDLVQGDPGWRLARGGPGRLR